MKKTDNVRSLTAWELSEALRAGALSAAEVTEEYLAAVREREPDIHAYITVTEKLARENAASADIRLREGTGGALCGIPFSVKDNLTVKGYPTTCASRMLADFVPPYSATVCEKLWEEGAVVLGKTNMDEFGMGSSCEKSVFGPTANPLDPTKVPGGSSGGAAASVAAGEAAFALGTDTGGSARQPAAFCGLVSMKPTYGLVSRYGMVELASSLEQICPITKDVRDNALVLSAICGEDSRDMTSLPGCGGDFTGLNGELPGGMGEGGRLRIGIFAGFDAFCDDITARCVGRAAGTLSGFGVTVDEVQLPSPDLARDIYMITMAAEASSNLARYDGIRYGSAAGDVTETRSAGFGEEVRRRIITGTFALSSLYKGDYYRKIKSAGAELCRLVDALFETYDMLIMPTAGTTAFALGAYDRDPGGLYSSDRFTVYANLTGCPALTIPCGGDGVLPCGLTLMGPKRSEKRLYETAAVLEAEWKDIIGREVKRVV